MKYQEWHVNSLITTEAIIEFLDSAKLDDQKIAFFSQGLCVWGGGGLFSQCCVSL